jgi:tryptophan synthase alpha chain
LVYANLVEARGREHFYEAAARAGVDSVLVADAPTVEVQPFALAARAAGIHPVLIATPNASEADLAIIAAHSSGYTYVVSRAGVTGAEEEAPLDHHSLIGRLDALGAAPSLLGFGISRPEHVRAAIRSGARGAICGSAVVALCDAHQGEARHDRLALFVREMKAATRVVAA